MFLLLYLLTFLYRRMQKFEHELCTTVDAILNILGHKPRITKEILDKIAPVSVASGANFYMATNPSMSASTTIPRDFTTKDPNSFHVPHGINLVPDGEEIVL